MADARVGAQRSGREPSALQALRWRAQHPRIEAHPQLRATRVYEILRGRGYPDSPNASRLSGPRPAPRPISGSRRDPASRVRSTGATSGRWDRAHPAGAVPSYSSSPGPSPSTPASASTRHSRASSAGTSGPSRRSKACRDLFYELCGARHSRMSVPDRDYAAGRENDSGVGTARGWKTQRSQGPSQMNVDVAGGAMYIWLALK